MKAKHSLFLLLAVLLAPWAANAQDNNTIVLDGNKDIAIQPGETYNFYDSGGAENNYGHGEEYTLTLTCNGYITINFSQFETRPSSDCLEIGGFTDYMLIYDGEASEDNLLIMGQTRCPSSLDTGTDYMATSGIMTIKWKSNNGTEDSGWVATITGVCAPVVVNSNSVYTENFDSYNSLSNNAAPPIIFPDDPLPQCWQFINRSNPNVYGSYPLAYITTSSYYAANGNCLLFSSSGVKDLYAVLPEFEENISGYQLTFTYRNEGTSESNGTLYVGYMTDLNDASTFVQTLACPKTRTMTTTTAYFIDAPQGSYMAFKYAGGTVEGYFVSVDNVVVSEAPTCFPTGKPTHGELSAHTAKLSWDLVDPTQTAWEVQYSKNQDFSEATVVTATTHEDFQISGLDAETQYHVQVRAKCSETDFSAWSETLTFTTLSTCPVPTNLAASNLTQESAKINWTGSIDVESYAVRYHKTDQVVGIDERFNTASLPEGWESKKGLLSDIMDGGAFGPSDQRSWIFGANGYGVSEMSAYLVVNGTDRNDWLITKRHTVTPSDAFSFYLSISSTNPDNSQIQNGPDDRFVVLITADDGRTWNILREWNNSGSGDVYINISPYEFQQESIDLSEYVGKTVRIAFYGESTVSNASNCLHLDNVVFGTSMAASEPQTQTGITGNQENAANSFVIQGLVANTEYEVQVKSECSDPEVWSAPITFRTLDPYMKVFVGGDISATDEWSNPNNWVPAGVPTINQGVELQANATIPSGYVAEANQIEGDYGLTIEDGGQLKTNNGVYATMKKTITAYPADPDTKAGYYLIASPLKDPTYYGQDGTGALNLLTTQEVNPTYDFYKWVNDQDQEWRNYRTDDFCMENGSGYLYANQYGTELSFVGQMKANDGEVTQVVQYNGDYGFGGWYLLGNPFTCDVHLTADNANVAFYRMNADGDAYEAATGVIHPMEGFFVQVPEGVSATTIHFNREQSTQTQGQLNINLSRTNTNSGGVSTFRQAQGPTIDNAIIAFGEGHSLGKLSFQEQESKIYMPYGGQDNAVVFSAGVGELPLNFEAAEDGTYTLSFENATEGLVYCHLIDNLTGADVDLLTPAGFPLYKGGQGDSNAPRQAEYTFTAKKSDYASRFKVVFASVCGDANGDNETFAFNHNGNWIIANEGRATLQVIDLTGRILSSEQIEGSVQTQINQPAGLYLIRLVNGDNVKLQKVVVR